MKWARGMRFRFAKEAHHLGSFAGSIGVVAKRHKTAQSTWWFTMEDRSHPDWTPEARWHVDECYMEPVIPEHGWPSVEQADAWLDSYTAEEAS